MSARGAPPCLACGKPLRRYRYRRGGPSYIEGIEPHQQWGGYGDNRFCGITCGWRWALRHTADPLAPRAAKAQGAGS